MAEEVKEVKKETADEMIAEIGKTTDIKKMNIYEKLSEITNELGYVAKNLEVSTGKDKSYKAVSEVDVLAAIKPLEYKYRVYSYPYSREILESNLLETESEYQGKVNKKTTFMTRICTVYRFVNIDNPTEYIDITSFAEGIDAQDKGSGKAMTYSDKYALLKSYKISTGEDPDVKASEEIKYSRKASAPSQPKVTGPAITPEQMGKIKLEIVRTGITEQQVLAQCHAKDLNSITADMADKILTKFKNTPNKEDR